MDGMGTGNQKPYTGGITGIHRIIKRRDPVLEVLPV